MDGRELSSPEAKNLITEVLALILPRCIGLKKSFTFHEPQFLISKMCLWPR